MQNILDYLFEKQILPGEEHKSLFDFSSEAKIEAETYEKIVLLRHELENLQTIADGWAYPLQNFMNET